MPIDDIDRRTLLRLSGVAVADEWTVVDDTFTTSWTLSTANQDIWIGNWAGGFFKGRGVPERGDRPPEEA